jgi:hypothetical protein
MACSAYYSTLRMQWMHDIIARTVSSLPAPGPSPAKRAAPSLIEETDAGCASLLRDRRLLRAKGSQITSFVTGLVVGFLPRPLPGKVLQGLPDAVHEQLHGLLSEALPGFEERAAAAKLLFDSSRDGHTAVAFHAACDGQGPTLVVLSEHGWVYGGYVHTSWSSANGFGDGGILDARAFLLVAISSNDGGVPMLVNPHRGVKAMTSAMLARSGVVEVHSF